MAELPQKVINESVEEQTTEVATQVYNDLGTRFGVAKVPFHIHNGTDSNRVLYSDLSQKQLYIHWNLPGTTAATATNYGVFLIAPFACTVMAFSEVHQAAGTAGGTVSLQLEKLSGTEAPDSGMNLLRTALSLKTTANTVQNGQLIQTASDGALDVNLALNDRLCLKDSGTLTSVANVSVIVTIQF